MDAKTLLLAVFTIDPDEDDVRYAVADLQEAIWASGLVTLDEVRETVLEALDWDEDYAQDYTDNLVDWLEGLSKDETSKG